MIKISSNVIESINCKWGVLNSEVHHVHVQHMLKIYFKVSTNVDDFIADHMTNN